MPKSALKPLPIEAPPAATIALVRSSSLPMLVQRELERDGARGGQERCRRVARQTLAQRGVLPLFTREHRDIVAKIASGNAAAAAKALHDHVMGSRERMRQTRAAHHAARQGR